MYILISKMLSILHDFITGAEWSYLFVINNFIFIFFNIKSDRKLSVSYVPK